MADPTRLRDLDTVRRILASHGYPARIGSLAAELADVVTMGRAESAERIAALQRDAEMAAAAENANAADLRAARERIAALEALVQEARVTLGRVQATLEALPSPAAPPVAGPAGALPDGFRLEGEAAMCGGKGPDRCRKGASCRKHNRCVYGGAFSRTGGAS